MFLTDIPNGKIDNNTARYQCSCIQGEAKIAEGDSKPGEVQDQGLLPHVGAPKQIENRRGILSNTVGIGISFWHVPSKERNTYT